MKATTYPSTRGVPHLAMIGPSTATKSTAVYQTMAKLLQEVLSSIIGSSKGQHTIIPTHFFGSEEHSCNFIKLQVTLKSKFDSDALFKAVEYVLRNFVSNSNNVGIPLSAIINYVSTGKFVEILLTEVSGAVRLERLRSDTFIHLVQTCVLSLLENFNTSDIDSAIAKMKSDKERKEAKLLHFSNELATRWDQEFKNLNSPTVQFIEHVETTVMNKLKNAIPVKECWSDRLATCEVDLSNGSLDKEHLKRLLDPGEPFSLIVEHYEIAHGLSQQLLDVFKKVKESVNWPKELPFRLVIIDTAGLTQDSNANEFSMKLRLKTALNRDIDGIWVMLPVTAADHTTRSMQRLFSNQNEEGRQIRNNRIQIHVGITRSDEMVTPTSDADYDKPGFVRKMEAIYNSLKALELQAQQDFSADSAKCVTHHYKKVKSYIEDLENIGKCSDECDSEEISPNLKEVAKELTIKFKELLDNNTSLKYLVEIITSLQKQIFSSFEVPIFFKSVSLQENFQHFNVNLFSTGYAKEVALDIARMSESYQFQHWLHWNTAYAFQQSVQTGAKFVSRAIQNGRISIYIDGDVQKAINRDWSKETCQINYHNISFADKSTTSLLNALGLAQSPLTDSNLRDSLRMFFYRNFSGDTQWRFNRAMSRSIRRLSYLEPKIKDSVDNAFREGRAYEDASRGVYNMLSEYKNLYQAHDFYQTISTVLNDELSKEFNKLFYVLN
ncbi:hypothetical protein [Gorillibacterium sp. CAU 1737]|uniref:hypothetical protein n=1 Tax=Gorillibacterium sp. CAU 1737 TaxID=3140362 RepID=UPI00326142CF